MATGASSTATRSARLGLRATLEQEVVLRRAAEVAHKSLTDFILDSACLPPTGGPDRAEKFQGSVQLREESENERGLVGS